MQAEILAEARANERRALGLSPMMMPQDARADEDMASPPTLTPLQPEASPGPRIQAHTIAGTKHLNYAEIAAILRLSGIGKTQREIAEVIGVSQQSIQGVLSHFATEDTCISAKAHLRSKARVVAEAAVGASLKAASHGDGSVALEILDRLDVAPRRLDKASPGTKVLVMVGQANPAALPPAVFASEVSSAS